jgi:hypothetical protein
MRSDAYEAESLALRMDRDEEAELFGHGGAGHDDGPGFAEELRSAVFGA